MAAATRSGRQHEGGLVRHGTPLSLLVRVSRLLGEVADVDTRGGYGSRKHWPTGHCVAAISTFQTSRVITREPKQVRALLVALPRRARGGVRAGADADAPDGRRRAGADLAARLPGPGLRPVQLHTEAVCVRSR